MVEKCRICLGMRKTLTCIFDTNKNVSYADMIASLGNIKISKHDDRANKICRSCRNSLQEAYDFKLLILRSDAVLNKTSNQKRINFSNLDDIKVEIKIEIDNKASITKCEDIQENFKHVEEICYSDTTIKKIENTKSDDVFSKPVPVLEFLKTIKDEPNADDGDDFNVEDFDMNCTGAESDNDSDYSPTNKQLNSTSTRKKRKQKSHHYKGRSDIVGDGDYIPTQKLQKINKFKKPMGRPSKRAPPPEHVTKVCIKPVYLKDLKLIAAKPTQIRRTKKKICKGDKYDVCPHCGIITKSLKSHILVHTGERKFKCNECSKGFFTEANLKTHTKTAHAKTRDFKCDKCTATFVDKSGLRGHQIVHNPEMNHVCNICNKAFKRRHALRRHVLGHNSANKNVMCDLCNMSFFSKFGLRHHMRIHTGERPYNCQICSQPYSYKHDFNRHCLKKHGVFFKRRSVYVMNEEVLKQERALMKELMLRVHGVIQDDKPINPFEGPQAALAFEQTIKALEAKQISIDFQL